MASRRIDGNGGNTRRRLCLAAAAASLALAGPLGAYESATHQKLTFVAAKQLNRCLEESDLPKMRPLQLRVIIKENANLADRNIFLRMIRWNYYDRGGDVGKKLLWVVDTRFHEHFDRQVQRLSQDAAPTAAYRRAGRILNYVQEVTSPAHAVPVYTARWWRLGFRDRFDGYRVDQARLAAAVERSCRYVLASPADYHSILRQTAEDTLTAVQAPMFGLPTTWEAFWTPHEDAGKFGEYGPAGNNFGRDVSFRCGDAERCVLLREDPLYQDFALQRHITAVVASMRVLLTVQRRPPAPGAGG